MDKSPSENEEFAKLTRRFQFFQHDSRDNETAITRKYDFRYNHVGFLFLDNQGQEFARIEKRGSFVFDATVIKDIEKIENEYLQTQSLLVTYVNSMLQPTGASQQDMGDLVDQLASEKFEARQEAEHLLLQLGSDSHQFLIDSKPGHPESRQRIKRILAKLAPLKATAARHELTRNVPFLARHYREFEAIASRLQSILPNFELESIDAWWESHSGEYQWNRDTNQYMRVTPESLDQTNHNL